jgi:hypothetical protein
MNRNVFIKTNITSDVGVTIQHVFETVSNRGIELADDDAYP